VKIQPLLVEKVRQAMQQQVDRHTDDQLSMTLLAETAVNVVVTYILQGGHR
jgi:hypothetical protein